ncbi:YopT-type cysteine protease domain-containing protein [Legionella clemsonensis]|uniref:Virulence surface antigen n=1 Tax=Legionella clemsonensis TaxID=1867846 RepID=A0A222NZT1_9GAMM|nr:YopT-type cysteine protease domain-containing protein [Legionella clemsonensis]ASQ45100.1 virulence surface antigen [Legionella clemsonensis]
MQSNYERTFQYELIQQLNRFSEKNHLKITLNPSGVCHALSILWVEHVNNKQLDKFERLLEILREEKPKEDVIKWIKIIDKLQEPQKYNAKQYPWKIAELTTDNVLYKEASFFPLDELLSTIKKFDLKNGSIIFGYNEKNSEFNFGHAIGLSQNEQDQYLFFDPNIGETIRCDSEEELRRQFLNLLHQSNTNTEIFPASITYTSKVISSLDHTLDEELSKDKEDRINRYYDRKYSKNSLLSWIVFHGDTETAETLINNYQLKVDLPTFINAVESHVDEFLAAHQDELLELMKQFYKLQAEQYNQQKSPGFAAQMRFTEQFGKHFNPEQLKIIKERFIDMLEKTIEHLDKQDKKNLQNFIRMNEKGNPFLSHPREKDWFNKLFDTDTMRTMKKLTH